MIKKQIHKKIAESLLIGGLLLTGAGCSTTPYITTATSTQTSQPQYKAQYLDETSISTSSDDTPENLLIVLSPHFDDAVLSLGGYISDFQGPKFVVTFFSSVPDSLDGLTKWDDMSGFDKSSDSRKIREKENTNSLQSLGAKIINKSYIDNQYEMRSELDKTVLVSSITDDIKQIINSRANYNLTVIGPAYFGEENTHADHLLVSKSLMQVAKDKTYSNTRFYFYEDEPYTQKKFAGEEITLDKMLTDFYPGLQLTKREVPISKYGFDSKIKGIELYKSQEHAFHVKMENIIQEVTDYAMSRCIDIKPCEVIYEIK